MNRDIDYSQKIMTFKSLTDTSDDEIALNYLENFNWDEEVIKILNKCKLI